MAKVELSRRRAVPSRGVHRGQPDSAQPGGAAVLQQAQHLGAVGQRGEAGGEDDATELPPLSVERGASVAECHRLQPGEPVATVGAVDENRQVVADQPTAAAGQDGRTAGKARPILLALAGREPSDAPAVRVDGTADRVAANCLPGRRASERADFSRNSEGRRRSVEGIGQETIGFGPSGSSGRPHQHVRRRDHGSTHSYFGTSLRGSLWPP